MVEKYCDGILPAVAHDKALSDALQSTVNQADAAITKLD